MRSLGSLETRPNDTHRSTETTETRHVKANGYNREIVQEFKKESKRTEESETLPYERSNGKN